MKKLFPLLLFLMMFSVSAQVTTSKIKGTVTDKTGEPLMGANIVVKHEPTGTISGIDANENGKYTIPNLRVGGPYTITFSYVGFKSQEVKNVFLVLGKTTNINSSLAEDGEQLEEIVISASKSKVFNNDRTGAQTSVSATQLKTLPTISRSAEDFTRLEPTASGGSFGGRNDQFNNFSLDGSIFNNPFGLDAATPGGQTSSQPISLDAIEQISVSVAPYDVTQSGFTGASVDAVTKSGTNDFKGTFYGYFRNQDMTGGKVKGTDVFKAKLNQSQFGASIGGPIIKDKLFFFTNIERDFRTDLGQAWTPNRGTDAVNESRVLEQDLINVRNILASIGYNTGFYEGFTHDSGSIKGIFKLDWNVNEKHRLALIYNFLDAYKEKPAHPTAINRRGPDFNTLQFQNSGYQISNKINSFLLELNSTFNSSTTNKLQVGYTKFYDLRSPFSSPAPVINIYKDGSPYIIAGHEPFSINNKLDQRVFQLTNNMNFFKGNHTITVGFSFEKFMFENSFNLKGYGFDVFSNVKIQDFLNGVRNGRTFTITKTNNDGTPLLDYAGKPVTVTYNPSLAVQTYNSKNALGEGVDGGWNLAEMNFGQLAFYLQDEWEMNDNFKLTYGVRFDKPLYFDSSELAQKFIDTKNSEYYNPTIEYYNPETGNSTFFDSTKMPTNKWLISPRIGFNWNVGGNNTLQVRGGTGLFTGRLPFVWIGNQIGGVDRFFYQVVDKDFQFPQVWRSSLGFDYKFENGIIATVDASFTKDINGIHVQNWGLKKPSANLQGVDNRPYYLKSDHSQWVAPWGSTERGNAYVLTNSDKGRAINATFKLQKNFNNGLFASVAYNFLDSKDVNSIEAEITGDAFSFNPALGNVNNDILANSKYGDKHRVIAVASKKFTYGLNNKWATTLSMFAEFAQGNRFSYTYGGDINNDGSGVNDLIYIPTASEINQMNFSSVGQAQAFENYIQQDEYLSSRRGKYAERYGALSPWRNRVDVKLLQDFNFKAGNRDNTLQFSVDILNVGNLINSDWGVTQQPNSVQPIGVEVTNGVPTYTFDASQTKTFGYDTSIYSRWQMQLGLRYIF